MERNLVDLPAPAVESGRRRFAGRPRPLARPFPWTALRLIASVLREGFVNLVQLGLFLFVRRRRTLRRCHGLLLGPPSAAEARPPDLVEAGSGLHSRAARPVAPSRIALVAVWGLALAAGAGGCRSLERDCRETVWSIEQMTGIRDVDEDWEDLKWSLGVFGDVRSELGQLQQTFEMLAR